MVLPIQTKLPRNILRGICLLVLTFTMLTTVDTISKYLSAFIHPLAIAWVRFAGQSVLITVVLLVGGNRGFWRSARPFGQLLRSAVAAALTVANFTALQYLQLDIANTIFFMAPVLVTMTASFLLGEKIGWWRTSAIILGFIGVLIVVNPQSAAYHPAMFLQLAAAALFAAYVILTRWLAHYDSAATQVAYMPVVGVAVLLPLALLYWRPVETADQSWLLPCLLVGICLAGSIAHWSLGRASAMMDSQVLVACSYQQLLYMMLAGWVVFGDKPAVSVLIGAPVVIAAGVIIAVREYALQQR